MIPIQALIISEDKETLTILEKFTEEHLMLLQIVEAATSVNDGIEAIQLKKPDVIFLDIAFREGTFFERLNQLDFNIPKLIFISQEERYAAKAFRHNAIDFLLKPVEFNTLILAVYKAIKQIEMERSFQDSKINAINILNASNQSNDFVAISSLDQIELIPMSEILFCQAEGKYTIFFLINRKRIMSSRNLGEYATLLDPNYFFRIHHSYIINIRQITKILKKEGYCCEISNGTILPVAKRRQDDFNKFIKLKV